MISIIYISNRYGGLDILRSNLQRQTFKNFELVFVDGLYSERKDLVKDYFKDFNIKHIDDSHILKEGYHSKLARCDNLAFKNCDNELIVSLQDYIYIPALGLEKFWNVYQEKGKALYTGKGHQYYYPQANEIINPKGLITVFEEDYTKKPDIKFWTDPRDFGIPEVRLANPIEWEMNWAAIPREIIYELGGMDEQYDSEGFAFDNTNIATRASILGYQVYLDNTNECFGFNHDGWWPNPLKVNRVSPEKYHFEVINKMAKGEIPVKLNYLA